MHRDCAAPWLPDTLWGQVMALFDDFGDSAGLMTHYDDAPTMLLIGDDPAELNRIATTAEQAGFRLVDRTTLDHARERLDVQVALDLLYVRLDERMIVPTALLASVAALAAAGQWRAVIDFPSGMIDEVVDCAGAAPIELLCDPLEADRLTALCLAMQPRRDPVLHDATRSDEALRLQRLTEEVSRIARALAELSSEGRAGLRSGLEQLADKGIEYTAEPPVFIDPDPLVAADEVRQCIRLRRLRERYFDATLFADPAWDMLLDLMAARLEHKPVAVSSLCIAAHVPPTTALRWIKTMTDQGLFERRADPSDGRRVYVALSDRAANGMARYFSEARAGAAGG